MIKHLFRTIVLLILALGIISFTWLTMSTPGLKTSLYVLQKVIPGELRISGIQGSFSQGMTIAKLSYSNPQIKLEIENLHLKTQPLALFKGELRITELTIEQLQIVSLPSNTPSAPLTELYWYIPLKIALQNIMIKHISSQHNTLITKFDNLLLNGMLSSNHLELTQLQLTYNSLIYHLEGQAGVKPLEAILHFSIMDLQLQPKFALSLNAIGDWQQLALKGQVTIPATFSFESTISDVFKNPRWTLHAIIEDLNPHNLNPKLDSVVYQGEINAQGTPQQLTLDAQFIPQENREKQRLQLKLTSADLQNLFFAAHLQWENINWPLVGTPQYTSAKGDLKLAGNPHNYNYTADVNLQSDNIPVSDWEFSGSGNQHKIQLSQLKILTLGGKINGNGFFKWQQPLNYQLNLTGTNLDPEHQWSDWAGNINFAVDIQGQGNKLALQFSNLTGTLRQQALHGDLALNIEHNKLTDINAKINCGTAKFIINAERKPNLYINWNVSIPDLAKLTPFGSGTLQTQGDISKLSTAPTIKGHISGHNLALLNYQAGKLVANFDLDANTTRKSSLTIDGDNLKLNQLLFESLTIHLNGNPQKFNLFAGAVVNDNVITTSAQGNYSNNQWRTIFQQLDWKTPDNIPWNLAAPFKLDFSPEQLNIDSFDWRANQQAIQLDTSWLFGKLPTGRLLMHNVGLNNFDQFLPNNIMMDGMLDLQLTNHNDPKNTALLLNAHSERAHLYYYDNPQATDKKMVTLKNFTAQLNANTSMLTSKVDMKINDQDYLHLTVTLPQYDIRHAITPEQAITGELTAQFSELNFLAFFTQNLHNVSGQLITDLKWNGKLSAPHPVGNLELRNASASVTPAHLNLTKINFKLQADAENQIKYKLQMNSGEGWLTVNGTTDYWQEHFPTSLKIVGNDFLFMNTTNYKIVASPNLTLTQKNQRYDLTGKIDVAEAIINYHTANDVVTLPSDVSVKTATNPDATTAFWNDFYANIQLTLGKNIKLSLDNLTAQLTGQLTLKDSPKIPTLATGELTITTGTYTAFGQTLNINNGKLMYTGGLVENPGLLIKATKSIQTYVNPFANSLNSTSSTSVVNITPQVTIIVVGISVTNTLKDPVLTLFSDQPNLTKTDILSYLVLGYPLSQANPSQGSNLIQAASALNLGEGQSTAVFNDLQNKFQLDQVGLQASNYLNSSNNSVQQNTSLVLGKLLSPRLFVSYSIGLLAPINTVTASYSLTRNLSTQTSSNNIGGSGIDFIYSFEHD
jgi:translocation and assembly module TamB